MVDIAAKTAYNQVKALPFDTKFCTVNKSDNDDDNGIDIDNRYEEHHEKRYTNDSSEFLLDKINDSNDRNNNSIVETGSKQIQLTNIEITDASVYKQQVAELKKKYTDARRFTKQIEQIELMTKNTKRKGMEQLSELVRQQQVDKTKKMDTAEKVRKKQKSLGSNGIAHAVSNDTARTKSIPNNSKDGTSNSNKNIETSKGLCQTLEPNASSHQYMQSVNASHNSENIIEWEIIPDSNQPVLEYTNNDFDGHISMFEVVNVQKQIGENAKVLVRYSCGSVEWGDINTVWSDARRLITTYNKEHAKLFMNIYAKQKTEDDMKVKEERKNKREEAKKKKEEDKKKKEEAKKKREDEKKQKCNEGRIGRMERKSRSFQNEVAKQM
jgi:hypothetical protein